MIGGKGKESLSDEQLVFADCVEDVLTSTPGLHYAIFFDRIDIRSRDPSVYALFLVETNPTLNLAVSIELSDKAFVIRLNGMTFGRKRGLTTRFEWWVERRCRDVERLVGGDLRLVHQTILGIPLSTVLEAGNPKKWRKIASRENGWVAILAYLVPYGFLMGGKKERVLSEWFAVGTP